MQEVVHEFRLWRKDIGVALVAVLAIVLGLLLRYQVESRVTTYQDPNSGFSITYPVTWGSVTSLQNALLKVEDPLTDSTYKTNLSISQRDLDPSSPPTLQTLMDRRVAQQSALTSYHFLANRDAVVDGAKGMELEYAYTVQPIDQPRRASLPVVVHAREYLVVTASQAFYITLAAPESDYDRASAKFDGIVKSIKLQGAR
ncbi:MAG: hypothetical protein WCF84_17460 [Anaerolineae bacterium]